MTVAKAPQFRSFEAYLAADPSELPEGRFEYWDGDLVELMPESIFNDGLANHLMVLLVAAGISVDLIRPHSCEVAVPGRPRTRLPDLVLLEEIHLTLLAKRATITGDMPPPPLVVEVVSPGNETSANYKRDYQAKPKQYADRGIPELWLIDPDRAVVKVGTLAGAMYQFRDFTGKQIILSPTCTGLNLTAAQVLRTKNNPRNSTTTGQGV
jgi:Uma2 family endonuclease